MKPLKVLLPFVLVLSGLLSQRAMAEEASARVAEGWGVAYSVGAAGVASQGDFSPYYIASMRGGTLTQGKDAMGMAAVQARYRRPGSRLAFRAGAEFYGGYANSVDYLRWSPSTQTMGSHPLHPSRIWIQQLYLQGDYRSVFLSAGMQRHDGGLLDPELTSGDLVESGNARPIPQVRVGFLHFVDVPLTNGWVQIEGQLSYGKPMDDTWLDDHFNHYSGHINRGAIYSYKRCRFRTKPSQPFSVTVGMQVAVRFGGLTTWYEKGRVKATARYNRGLGSYLKAFIPFFPQSGDHYDGSSLGSWDLLLRYRLPNGAMIKAYMEKPYEDGSGIGFRNGWDGLWGLQFSAPRRGLVSGAVVEYIDFTNQSGPMHWQPDQMPGTTITSPVGGADNYYNNYQYDAYANYGMAIGSPFIPSPIYFRDGSVLFQNNRVRGFHMAVAGNLSTVLSYRLMGGYRKGWGRHVIPLVTPTHSASFMAEATYTRAFTAGRLAVSVQLGLDRGTMFGNNFGGCLSVVYTGLLGNCRPSSVPNTL